MRRHYHLPLHPWSIDRQLCVGNSKIFKAVDPDLVGDPGAQRSNMELDPGFRRDDSRFGL